MARWGCVTEPLLNFKQAAERLNIPESWLREKVAKRQVPHTRFGKHVRFTEADLAAIIEPAINRQPLRTDSRGVGGSLSRVPVRFRHLRLPGLLVVGGRSRIRRLLTTRPKAEGRRLYWR